MSCSFRNARYSLKRFAVSLPLDTFLPSTFVAHKTRPLFPQFAGFVGGWIDRYDKRNIRNLVYILFRCLERSNYPCVGSTGPLLHPFCPAQTDFAAPVSLHGELSSTARVESEELEEANVGRPATASATPNTGIVIRVKCHHSA